MNTAVLSVRGAGRGAEEGDRPDRASWQTSPGPRRALVGGQEGRERQLPEYEVRRAREWKPPSAPSPASSDAGSAARPGEPRVGTGGHTGRLTWRFPCSVVTAPFE